MSDYRFERESRTPYSESYVIEVQDDAIGRIDIHYTASVTYATLCIPESLTDQETRDLVSEINERLVLTADPFREDFVVTVWAGREAAFFSDEDFEGDEDEDEDEELEGNSHRGD